MEAFRDESRPVRGPLDRRESGQPLRLVPAHRVPPCRLRPMPVQWVHVPILHPWARPRPTARL